MAKLLFKKGFSPFISPGLIYGGSRYYYYCCCCCCCCCCCYYYYISSALCYCTAEQLSSRGRLSSVRRPENNFPQNLSSRLMPNWVERYLFTISPHDIVFLVFQNFAVLIFYIFFFVFVNIGLRSLRTIWER